MTAVPPEIMKQVKGIELRTRGLVSALFAGEYRSVFRGQGMEFAEVRAYEPGDDFRSIDWNVSARLASPFVKTYTEERELTLMLVVDQSGSTRIGDPVSKVGLEVEVAAVLALAAAYQNDRVGALLFAEAVEHVVPPRKGRRHALRCIRDLIAFAPASKKTNLGASLTYTGRLLRHRSIVVVLSDFLATDWERPLRRLAAKHEVVAVTVDDPRERTLPDAGVLWLEDAESGQLVQVDTTARRTRDALARHTERRRLERARMITAAGVDQVALVAGQDYAPILRRAFAARARRLHRG
jgi:uncharacterized protein (DUF58 family)